MDSKLVNIGMELNILAAIFKYQDKFFTENPNFLTKFLANPTHRIIFEKLQNIRNEGKSIPSLKVFREYITTEPTLSQQDITIIPKVLDEIPNCVPKFSDLDLITKTVTKLYVARSLIKKTNEIVTDIDKAEISDLLTELKGHINTGEEILNWDKAIDTMALKGDIDRRIEYVNNISKNPEETGLVQTGLKNFDKFFPRQSPGQFVLFQARTNVGKSMFLKNTALVNFQAGLNVLVITIEMNAMEWALRIDAEVTGFKHNLFTSGKLAACQNSITKWKEKVQNLGVLSNNKSDLMIYWQPSNCTPAKVDSIIAKCPFKPHLVVIDYAGDMKSGLKGMSDYDAVSHAQIYSSLKEIAGRHKCVLYSAQQTKRGVKKVSDESGAWSDVASGKTDLMIAIEKTKEDELFETEINGIRYSQRLTATVVKGRHIPKECYTKIIPNWEHMCWIEAEFDAPKFEGRIDNEKTSKQKTKDAIKQQENIPDLESSSNINNNQNSDNQKIDTSNQEVSLEIDALM